MRPRPGILLLRRLVARSGQSTESTRTFTLTRQTSNVPKPSRPQLPFLSIPTPARQRVRYLTTERKRWLKHELKLSIKYTAYLWSIGACLLGIAWTLAQEYGERKHPTPREWSYWSRMILRGALTEAEDRPDQVVDWVHNMQMFVDLLKRLEDPSTDGKGVQDLAEGGIYVDGVGRLGLDVTAMAEPWRRGYHQALMHAARAAERVDGWQLDRTRNIVFPPDVVRGPSNPRPRPVPGGAYSAPREEDCELAFPPPETFYLRVLTSRGFTARQRMDAALAYASYLDYKAMPEAAARMYEWALSVATEGQAPTPAPYDPRTFTLNLHDGPAAPPPSANLLTALTALGVHKARQGDVSAAMPILTSVLMARRSLPAATAPSETAPRPLRPVRPEDVDWTQKVYGLFGEPPYPDPPVDGTAPPPRDARARCDEAALHMYIGELLYSAGAGSGREQGLAWTREAVDAAELTLHETGTGVADADATRACRECLSNGLENWAKMAARLARDEGERRAAAVEGTSAGAKSGGSWFGLWGAGAGAGASAAGKSEEVGGRWAAEEKVVAERTRRAREVLQKPEGKRTMSDWLSMVVKA